MGNGRNYMNSVVTVEYPAGPAPELRYIVALVSNVLRFNSAWDHSRFGAAIHQAMQTPGTVRVRNEATESELRQAGD